MQQFYVRLLGVVRKPVFREGDWQLLECVPAWDGNWTSDYFVAFAWQGENSQRLLVTVNYSPHQSQCYLRLPFPDLANRLWALQDLLGTAGYKRDGNDLQSRGLYLEVPPWQYHVFDMRNA